MTSIAISGAVHAIHEEDPASAGRTTVAMAPMLLPGWRARHVPNLDATFRVKSQFSDAPVFTGCRRNEFPGLQKSRGSVSGLKVGFPAIAVLRQQAGPPH
jgi:hypothetical protein